jgi:hypothetical protein
MTDENEDKIETPWGGYKPIKEVAETALDWASGSWGQGEYDKPKFDDETMAKLWYKIADIAREKAHNHHFNFVKKTEAK